MPPDQAFGDHRSTGWTAQSCGLVHEFLRLAVSVSDVYILFKVFPTHLDEGLLSFNTVITK